MGYDLALAKGRASSQCSTVADGALHRAANAERLRAPRARSDDTRCARRSRPGYRGTPNSKLLGTTDRSA